MDEKKAECVAVPTIDYQHLPTLAPNPSSHCTTSGAQPSYHRYRFMVLMIGVASFVTTYLVTHSFWFSLSLFVHNSWDVLMPTTTAQPCQHDFLTLLLAAVASVVTSVVVYSALWFVTNTVTHGRLLAAYEPGFASFIISILLVYMYRNNKN